MTTKTDRLLDQLEARLEAWKAERETNKYGLSHLADRAIAVIEDEIAFRVWHSDDIQVLKTDREVSDD